MFEISAQYMPFVQVILAMLFGMILGIERVLAGRVAGPRTYGLVSMGACLVTLLAVGSVEKFPELGNGGPYHLMSAVMTGIGFIGAGMIMFKNNTISGLTTAAGAWVSAAIGIGVGLGYTTLSLFVTFLTLFIFTVMWHLERKITKYFVEEDEG